MRPPTACSNAVSWRSEGIRYKKNEVFLDISENMHLSVAADGSVLQSKIQGVLRIRSCLSGMPELKLGLNDKLGPMQSALGAWGKSSPFEDFSFHQCVRLARFENDRVLSFMPPDGEFDLMTYFVYKVPKLPIKIKTAISPGIGPMQVEYAVSLCSSLNVHLSANSVEIRVPLLADAADPELETSQGSAAYLLEDNAVVWRIQRIQGSRKLSLTVKFTSQSAYNQRNLRMRRGTQPCIHASFEVPGLLSSRGNVRYLKIIEKSGYQATQQVRYSTQCVDYLQRLPL